MNNLPCPACKKSLFWNGIKTSDKFDTEGKRWYQYAGQHIYCRHCGVRLRNPHAGKLILAVFIGFGMVNSLVVQTLAKEYGSVVILCFVIVVLAMGAIYWPYYRYEKWTSGKRTNKP